MRIFLIRHGETMASKSRLISHDALDVGLSEKGILQAKNLRGRFSSLPNKAIISSPAKRCRQTAKIIFSESCDDVVLATELKEIYKGFDKLVLNYQGLNNMTVDKWERKFNSGDFVSRDNYSYPSGMSIRQMRGIVVGYFLNLVRECKSDNLIIVSHNGPIKAIIAYVLGDNRFYWEAFVDYAHYSEIDMINGSFILYSMNVV